MTFGKHDPRIDYFVKGAERQNFGDYLPEIFAHEFLTYPKVDADIFRLVGSVIEERWIAWDLARATGLKSGMVAYWCCGARRAVPIPAQLLAQCRFFGVRGPKTRDLLGLPADTVMGDPGLLAPLFHNPRPHPATRGKVIAIPHIEDPKSPAELLQMSGADLIVSPEIEGSEAALRDLLDQIASADFVLTSSLHGAVIACAYGRPFAFWNNGHIDAPFKWDDFAGSIGLDIAWASNVADGRRIYADQMAPSLRKPDLTAILDICPFVVRPSVMLRAMAYDGILDKSVAASASAALDTLASSKLDTVSTHLHDSAASRQARRRLTPQLIGKTSLLARATMRRLPPGVKVLIPFGRIK